MSDTPEVLCLGGGYLTIHVMKVLRRPARRGEVNGTVGGRRSLDNLIAQCGQRMPARRAIVNAPSSSGVTGLTTGLVPSLTLGCGTYGGPSTCDNVTYTHLQYEKRIARVREPDVECA